jgi:PKD repeat protein
MAFYGTTVAAARPASASVPAPTTSDPTTVTAEVKSCPPGPSGIAICLGAPSDILHSRIAVDPADQAGVDALRTNARNLVAGIHGWDLTDRRIDDWGQTDVWGAMFAELTGIIKKPANERTSDEQGAYHWFQQVVQQYRLKSAQNALNEYKNWQARQCAYVPGAPSPEYNPGVGCGGSVGGLLTGARVPTLNQLESWGSYEAAQQLGTSSSTAQAVGDGLAAGLAVGAIATGTAAGITLGATASAATVSSIAGGAATYTTVAGGIGTSIAGAAAGTIAIALFSVVVIVLAIVVLVIAIVQQAGYAQLPSQLQGAIDTAQSSLPDLGSMVGDTTNGGADLLGALFMGQTQISSLASVLPSSYVQHQADWHGDLLQTQAADAGANPPALSGPVVASKAVSVRSWGDPWDAITKATPAGGSPPPVTWLTDEGWFQQSIDAGGSWTTSSSLRYLDWSGHKRTALIQGDHFLDVPSEGGVTGASATNLCTDASKCSVTSTLHMLDANGTPIAVTTAPALPVAATINATSGGSPYTEGQPTTFTDPATDPRGLPVTYTWEFESRCLGLCFGSLDSAFHGNPAVRATGQTVSYTWPSAGTFHVRLTVTNAAGTQVTDRDVTVVKGAAPSITLNKPKSELGPIFSGGSVTVTGCITTAGGGFVRPTFNVDWGDGHTDTAQPPTIVFIVNGVPQESGPIVVQEGSATGCATPWSYTAHHVYTGADNQTFPVSVGVDDGEGAGASVVNAATVKILPKDLTPTSFGFTNATGTYHSNVYGDIPEFTEGQSAHLQLDFNAPPDAYGDSIDIDWDQYGMHTVFFTQCNLAGCSPETSYSTSNTFWSKPGTTGETVYSVVASIHDSTGAITRQLDIPVAVKNVSPTLSNVTITPSPAAQGQQVTLSGTVSRTDPNTPLGVKVTWPGFSGPTVDVVNLPPSLTSQTFHVTHVLRSVGTPTVTVQVADDASGSASGSVAVPVTNVPPAPTVGPMAVAEGAPVSLTVLTGDPGYDDSFTETVDWGDGTPPDTVPWGTSTKGTLGSPVHTYAEAGVYDVTVGVDDGRGGSAGTTTTVTVTNVSPVVTTQPGSSTAGADGELQGAFTDPGSDETYAGSVDWRDGSAPEPFAVAGGADDFALHHTYAHGGVYPVQVTVSDDHGGTSDVATGLMTVTGPPGFTADDPGDGIVGDPVAYQLSSYGFPLPSFALSDGALPPGLALDADGFLSGTPTATGAYTFRVTATNSEGTDESGAITMTIRSRPAFTADSPGGAALVGVPYSYGFAASGVPAPAFAVHSGALPPGLTLAPVSGALSGTPTTTGSYTFTVAAANAAGTALSASHTIVVKKPLTVTAPTTSREYGAADPPLLPSYDGFLPGDAEPALDTAPTCTTTAGAASVPGAYPVTCAGGVSATYAFTYVAGIFTVTKGSTATGVTQVATAAFGAPVTLTATVTGAGSLSGTVQFRTPAGNVGPPVPLSGGHASLTVTGVLTGRDVVTATYSGDALHATSSGQLTPAVTFGHTLSGSFKGSMTLTGGTWLLDGVSLPGALTIGVNTSVVLLRTSVGGVTATNPGAVTVCGSTLKNGLTISGASGFVLVGDPRDDGCAGNTVTGAVSIVGSLAGANLSGNRLNSGVRFDGNHGGGPFPVDAVPVVSANTVKAVLACANNQPAPTNDGVTNTAKKKSGQCVGL